MTQNDLDFERELELLHQRICPALGDPKRMRLLYMLKDGPRSVSMITEEMAIPQSSVSRHLAVLRERGIVSTERQGTSVYYSLADERILEALKILRSILHSQITAERGYTRGFAAAQDD